MNDSFNVPPGIDPFNPPNHGYFRMQPPPNYQPFMPPGWEISSEYMLRANLRVVFFNHHQSGIPPMVDASIGGSSTSQRVEVAIYAPIPSNPKNIPNWILENKNWVVSTALRELSLTNMLLARQILQTSKRNVSGGAEFNVSVEFNKVKNTHPLDTKYDIRIMRIFSLSEEVMEDTI